MERIGKDDDRAGYRTSGIAQITSADTRLTRLIGLMGRRRLDAGCGLLIRPSFGIHTFGMLFSIDVVALNKNLQVLKLWHRLAPCRMTSINLKTDSMLELPPGQIRHCQDHGLGTNRSAI